MLYLILNKKLLSLTFPLLNKKSQNKQTKKTHKTQSKTPSKQFGMNKEKKNASKKLRHHLHFSHC